MQRDRIVVGYDATAAARAALDWAVRHAVARSGVVQVVTAWTGDPWAVVCDREHRELLHRRQRYGIRRALAPLPPAERPVVTGTVVMADPTTALTYEALGADLVVIGFSHRGHVAGELARALAHQTPRTGGAGLYVVGEPRVRELVASGAAQVA